MSKAKFWILIPAAGVGKRMGGETPKQYLSLAGYSILEWTLKRMQQLNSVEQITLILNPADTHWQASSLSAYANVNIVTGGDERFSSVMNGLVSLKSEIDDNDWVLVHDAVRPCVTVEDIEKLISSLKEDPVGGLLASPVKDTLKKSTVDKVVTETVDRRQHWLCATPQMFRYGLLCAAMENAIDNNLNITDEASAMEAMGHRVNLVEGRSDNIKVTHQEDLALVEFLLKQEEGRHAI